MVAALLRLARFDLHSQVLRLREQAEDFKNRATDEIKRQVAEASITIGLALGGLVLMVFTLIVALVALYMWVEMHHGAFPALGVVGLTTAILGAILFTLAASRGGKRAGPTLRASSTARRSHSAPSASLVDDLTRDLAGRTAAATSEALDSVSEAVRKSPTPVVLATVAAAAVIGLLIGRRR